MALTRPFNRTGLSPVQHRERGNELLLVADQWMNIQHHYRADACATLAVAHYHAATMGGNVRHNPANNAQPQNAEEHKARALALITGSENLLARQDYAHADALASVAVAHYIAAYMESGPNERPTQPQPSIPK